MKRTSGRIPRAIDPFNAYIINTESYLRTAPAGAAPLPQPNWQRLGLIDSEIAKWTDFKNQWSPLYAKYSDKAQSRTAVITSKLRAVQRGFIAFAQRLLTMMAGMRTVTDDDAAVLHFAITRREPVRSVTPIADVPVFGMAALGGGEVKFTVRPLHDTKRASKIPGAEIEVRYAATGAGEARPARIDDMAQQFISSRAIFIIRCGPDATEKTLYAACRWVVVNSPARNGPWTVDRQAKLNQQRVYCYVGSEHLVG